MAKGFETLPPQIRTALKEAGLDPEPIHSPWTYADVFVREGADTYEEALTREMVEDLLEQRSDDFNFDNTRSTSNTTLNTLVTADILEQDKKGQAHRYWLAYSLDTETSQESSTTDSHNPVNTDPTTCRLSPTPVLLPLLALLAGGLVTFLSLIGFRLSVASPITMGSTILAGTLLSIGVASGSVTFATRGRQFLTAFETN